MSLEALATEAAGTASRQIINKASPKILSVLAKMFSQEVSKIRVQFTKTFEKHLIRTFERSYTIKTITSSGRPIPLEEIYVPLRLECGGVENHPDTAADPTHKEGLRLILSGTGGAGKTVLMKHLLNKSKSNRLGFIPIFVELRRIDFSKDLTLAQSIYDYMSERVKDGNPSLFEAGLVEGLFALYLDGFDEIHPDQVDMALRSIKTFSDLYHRSSILISTRPNTAATTLQDYTIFRVQPLDKDQSIDLITKSKFDELAKSRFLEKMQQGLYEKHRSLMSLPILLDMMLRSFRTYADIPDRMTVFYSQAFEALYSIHDSENKEFYRRVHHAGLSPDLFKSVLQAFCYITLSNFAIEFSESEIVIFLKRALKISGVNADPEKYKKDLVDNVCVLHLDGLNYVFVHRSFQEYFASLFALNFSGSNPYKVFDKIIDRFGSAVSGMLLEIDHIKTKRYWLIPKLKAMLAEISRLESQDIAKQFGAFYRHIFVTFGSDGTKSYSWQNSAKGELRFESLYQMSELFRNRFNFTHLVSHVEDLNIERITRQARRLGDDYIYFDYEEASITLSFNESGNTNLERYLLDHSCNDIIADTKFDIYFNSLKNGLIIACNEIEREIDYFSDLEDSELMSGS